MFRVRFICTYLLGAVVFAGSTLMDVGTAVHRQLAEKLRFSRMRGKNVHDGQKAQRTHVLNHKDSIELDFF